MAAISPRGPQRYEDLKKSLIEEGIWGPDYTRRKARFVREIVNAARRQQGLAPTQGGTLTTGTDLATIHNLRLTTHQTCITSTNSWNQPAFLQS